MAMRVGIGGVPNCFKSQFRRWLVSFLRDQGLKAEHWDADRFKKSRCPEDLDMREPTDDPLVGFWIVEDVRLTVPHKEVVAEGEKEGAWKPLSWYDAVIYLRPDWPTVAMNWASRAIQWYANESGDHRRESGSIDIRSADATLERVAHYVTGWQGWMEQDVDVLSRFRDWGDPDVLLVDVRLAEPYEDGKFAVDSDKILKFLGI